MKLIKRLMLGLGSALLAFSLLGLQSVAAATPAGPPIRIGSTLALTGPLSATAIIHKLTGEI